MQSFRSHVQLFRRIVQPFRQNTLRLRDAKLQFTKHFLIFFSSAPSISHIVSLLRQYAQSFRFIGQPFIFHAQGIIHLAQSFRRHVQ